MNGEFEVTDSIYDKALQAAQYWHDVAIHNSKLPTTKAILVANARLSKKMIRAVQKLDLPRLESDPCSPLEGLKMLVEDGIKMIFVYQSHVVSGRETLPAQAKKLGIKNIPNIRLCQAVSEMTPVGRAVIAYAKFLQEKSSEEAPA